MIFEHMARRRHPVEGSSSDAPSPEQLSVTPSIRKRTRARELALWGLYLVDVRGLGAKGEAAGLFRRETDDAAVLAFADVDLVAGKTVEAVRGDAGVA